MLIGSRMKELPAWSSTDIISDKVVTSLITGMLLEILFTGRSLDIFFEKIRVLLCNSFTTIQQLFRTNSKLALSPNQ
jgi:hypothetical protein